MKRRPHQWYSKLEFAEATGLTLRTVNRWDRAGLLPQNRRDDDGRYPFDIFTTAWRERAYDDKNSERGATAELRIRRFIDTQCRKPRERVTRR